MWVLFLFAFTFIVANFIFKWQKESSKKFPPGPRGYPVIGNLLQINQLVKETKFHWAAWKKLTETYGRVFRVHLGMAEPLVVVSGREAVMDFLSQKNLDGRPETFEVKLRSFGKKRGIVLNDGQDWSEQKRFLLKVLRDFGYSKQTMEELLLDDATMLCNILENKMIDKEIDVHEFCDYTAIAVISGLWTIVAGKRCDPTKGDSEAMVETLKILQDSFRNGSTAGALWTHMPFLRFIMPKYSGFTAQQERINRMSNYFLDEVKRHLKTKIPGVQRDLIDTYLDEIESRKNDNSSEAFDELQLVVVLKDLFAAGVETTSNTIGFGIVFLSKWPEVQEKCYKEIISIIGTDKSPDLSSKNSLPYLNATIAEILRHANVSSTTIAHRALTDCSVLGYDIKKNWTVIGSLISVHMDPNYWGDPKNFRPERFIKNNGQFFEDPWLMPFGSGRRKCMGENLARSSLFLFFASLLQKFQFSLAPNETAASLLGINGFTITPPHINIVITSRCMPDSN